MKLTKGSAKNIFIEFFRTVILQNTLRQISSSVTVVKLRLSYSKKYCIICTACKVSKYRVFSGSYFPAFGLNTEIYGVHLRIQSKYRKIRTKQTPCLDICHAVNGSPFKVMKHAFYFILKALFVLQIFKFSS